MAALSDILDTDLLAELAGDRSFQRGVDYFEAGCVRALAQYDERIAAQVEGTESYQVNLWLQDDELMARCTCPMGVQGYFCKHCVAVGLAWISEPPLYRPAAEAPEQSGTTMVDVRHYLERQDRDTLVQMILDQAMEDSRWREQLLMKAASQRSGGADIPTFRRALRNAIAVGDFVDYYASGDYADGVYDAISGLEALLEAGYAKEVVELSEEAILLLEDAINNVDDSNGELTPIMEQVQDLHLRACEMSHPQPEALAERLFHMELNSGFGFFDNALETYSEILGEAGRATYQALVDTEWGQLAALTPSEDFHFDYRRSQLNRMKEALMAATGNLEDLVAVIATDLSKPQRYLRIAQLYQEAGNLEVALEWAEQGRAAFQSPRVSTGGLVNFLITLYEQQGRWDDAVALVWEDLQQAPSLQGYQKLQQQAEKAQAWPQWRDKALDWIRQMPPPSQSHPYALRWAGVGHSLLVEIFLWEGNGDQAWQEAQAGGCSARLWMQLADLRAPDHPEDALSVYQPAVEPLVQQTNNQAYSEAVDLLLKIKTLKTRLNQGEDFDQFLAQLSTTYKRKRNFIKRLQQKGLL